MSVVLTIFLVSEKATYIGCFRVSILFSNVIANYLTIVAVLD